MRRAVFALALVLSVALSSGCSTKKTTSCTNNPSILGGGSSCTTTESSNLSDWVDENKSLLLGAGCVVVLVFVLWLDDQAKKRKS